MIKKLRKILPIVILISIGLGVMQVNNQFMVQGVLPADSYLRESMIWDVENITSTNNEWWNWTSFSFEANWHANAGDKLNISILDYKTVGEQIYLESNLELGNLSLVTNNYDIGSNLLLSVGFSWLGGLIALESNCDNLSSHYSFNTTHTTVNTDSEYTISGKTVSAINIQHDDGLQKTELYYERETGILLFADTSFLAYRLVLKLEDSTMILPEKTYQFGFGIITSILILGCSTLLLKKKRK
ncbi:MAG: hypothetical protein ACTSP7_05970 [Candidatus Heimdallarchaeota archaeon]